MAGTDLVKQLLVIGGSGQLARAIWKLRPDAVFLGRNSIDLAFPKRIAEALVNYEAYAIINAAAYTQVDSAEKEEELAFRINAEASRELAFYCAGKNIPLISFSSDYVFDGSGDYPWKEEDVVHPLNIYGRSKMAAEQHIVSAGGPYIIFRTSWVYDAEGKNFLNTILRLAGERMELRVINDQFGAPTYAMHLAQGLLKALDAALKMPVFPSGIYHLCNAGVTTWHGFASRIVELARQKNMPVKVRNIFPIPAAQYPLPAARPYNSRLDCGKVRSVFGIIMPDWGKGVEACMQEK